jgi:putative glutamine amidotransferase
VGAVAAASRPKVCITFSPKRPGSYYAPYVRAVAAAGAEPRLVAATPAPGRDLGEILAESDGLLLPGGWDLDPALYGEEPAEMLDTTDGELDRVEIDALTRALDMGMPVLGICRGQQVLNVALGGTLHQHVVGHDARGQLRSRLVHPIQVETDSELGRAAGLSEILVNSLHHQAVKDLGAGLRVTARSPDGVVEGVERDDGIVAVQCHPEELMDHCTWARHLLGGFVERAGRARKGELRQC